MGIPIVYVDFREKPFEHTAKSMELIGQLYGKEERAAEFNAFFTEQMGKVQSVIAAQTDTSERHADLYGGTEQGAVDEDVAAVKAATEEAKDADAESRVVRAGTPAAGGSGGGSANEREGEAGQ